MCLQLSYGERWTRVLKLIFVVGSLGCSNEAMPAALVEMNKNGALASMSLRGMEGFPTSNPGLGMFHEAGIRNERNHATQASRATTAANQ